MMLTFSIHSLTVFATPPSHMLEVGSCISFLPKALFPWLERLLWEEKGCQGRLEPLLDVWSGAVSLGGRMKGRMEGGGRKEG